MAHHSHSQAARAQRPPDNPPFHPIGSVEDMFDLFSDNPADYTIGQHIGFGASSVVYTAVYRRPTGSPCPCALKVLDLDNLPPHALRLLRRETQLMSLSKHPNVLRVRGSWMDGHKLYIALRLMNSGSASDVMRYAWPGGMEEDVVKCILKQSLEGLNYLHINGFIHRDIKAANLLIDDDGTVLLGDLGVATSLSDDESSQSSRATRRTVRHTQDTGADPGRPALTPIRAKRQSFVGTPCWMAPELISGKQYDSKADIWSFGITALELCHGRAPRSREAPAQVLLKTVHDASPTLEREGSRFKYSRALKEVIDSCLVKDPALRPTAQQLLDHPVFKSAKKKSYLVGAVLKQLPPLVKRQERQNGGNTGLQSQNPIRDPTMDSWDFSSSPIGSPQSSSLGLASTSNLPPVTPHTSHSMKLAEEVFMLEEDMRTMRVGGSGSSKTANSSAGRSMKHPFPSSEDGDNRSSSGEDISLPVTPELTRSFLSPVSIETPNSPYSANIMHRYNSRPIDHSASYAPSANYKQRPPQSLPPTQHQHPSHLHAASQADRRRSPIPPPLPLSPRSVVEPPESSSAGKSSSGWKKFLRAGKAVGEAVR